MPAVNITGKCGMEHGKAYGGVENYKSIYIGGKGNKNNNTVKNFFTDKKTSGIER